MGKSVRALKVKLTPRHPHEPKAPGVKSARGQQLLHAAAYYWLNEIPGK